MATATTGLLDFVRGLLLGAAGRRRRRRIPSARGRVRGQVPAGHRARDGEGLEDTCFYRYVRLLSLNDVGGGSAPLRDHAGGVPPAERAAPAALAAFDARHVDARHQAQRGRARAAQRAVGDPVRLGDSDREVAALQPREAAGASADAPVPSRSEEYLLYQTLVGSWPVSDRAVAFPEYRTRISDYMIKALREAKVNTSWAKPSERYEELVSTFVREVLNDAQRNPFLDDLDEFVGSIALPGFSEQPRPNVAQAHEPGRPRHLSRQRGLGLQPRRSGQPAPGRLRAPRGAARADRRHAAADSARVPALLGRHAREPRRRAREALCDLARAALARGAPELFELGSYAPIEPRGPRAEHLCALARRHAAALAVASSAAGSRSLPRNAGTASASFDWLDTTVALPAGVYRDVFSEVSHTVEEGAGVRVDELFARFPVGLLVAD